MMRWSMGILLFIGIVVGGWYVTKMPQSIVSPIGKILEKPLEKYTIDALSKRVFEGSQINLEEAIATTPGYTVWRFSFDSENKRVTGLAHIPASDSGNQRIKRYPVIVQLRGYVDREKYTPGEGTK